VGVQVLTTIKCVPIQVSELLSLSPHSLFVCATLQVSELLSLASKEDEGKGERKSKAEKK